MVTQREGLPRPWLLLWRLQWDDTDSMLAVPQHGPGGHANV
jgi:hypothetical protein